MQINASITGIKYQVFLAQKLQVIKSDEFDVNTCPSACIYVDENLNFAISKWISPKRTRSYPYEKVYNTLSNGKKITVIPIIKDEGLGGDRDFIQWDTVSMMSLLDVYVILAYYHKAEKSNRYSDKITNQKFDNQYVLEKIGEISQYHSSALHWNLKELNQNLFLLVGKVKICYAQISKEIGVKMHNEKGIDDFQNVIQESVQKFMDFSRQKAKEAQRREFLTVQPKEALQTLSKAKITITNFLGGQYFFTVDEIQINESVIFLIESKHAKSNLLPSVSDIKDGLLKMILYANLHKIEIDEQSKNVIAILTLTSTKLKSEIRSDASENDLEIYFTENKFHIKQKELVKNLFKEATSNHFLVVLKQALSKS